MAVAVIQSKVKDVAVWKPLFDGNEPLRRKHGGTGHRVLRMAADPTGLVVMIEFGTVEGARAFIVDPLLREVMQRAGVEGMPQMWVCEEVEAKTY